MMSGRSAHSSLRAKRTEIEGELEDVSSAAGLMGIMLGLVIPVGIWAGIAVALGIEDWLGEGFGLGVNIVILITLVLAGLFVPVYLIQHLMEQGFRRCYRYVFRWLKHTSAPKYIIQQELWDEVFAILDRRPLLKLTGVRMPRSLDEQIELASDYWPVVEALVRGDRRRLFWQVSWGSLTRLSDTITLFVFNGCMTWVLLLLSGALLFIPLVPITLVFLPMFVRRQGAQQALIDWFLDDPRGWLGDVSKPPYKKLPRIKPRER